MPLRLLAQLAGEAGLAARLAAMMDHRAERAAESGAWRQVQLGVVEPLVKLIGPGAVSEEQVQRCVGLFRTNGCQLQGTGLAEGEEWVDDAQLGKVRALYPTMATMSHSCQPNTRMLNSPGYRMVFRTVQAVAAGEELTICYSMQWSGVRWRAREILNNWFFSCCCPRCEDPTDLGWHSSSWRCADCGAAALPEADQGVRCTCGWRVDPAEVEAVEARVQAEVEAGPEDTEPGVREWAEGLLAGEPMARLHPHHHLAMAVKMRLMRAGATTPGQLERKVAVCREVACTALHCTALHCTALHCRCCPCWSSCSRPP
jgi:hypothetical protein